MEGLGFLYRYRATIVLVAVCFLGIGTAAAVNVSGVVTYNGNPISGMVLANGQHMFTNSADGRYSLEVPLDANSQITLFSFADGFATFSQTFPPSGAPSTIEMVRATPDSPEITITNARNDYAGPGRSRIEGSLRSFNGTPLVAMALANGQNMFTGSPPGQYDLDVPLDGDGNVTLMAFADGFQPVKIVFPGNTKTPPSGQAPAGGTREGGNRGAEDPYFVCLNVSPDGSKLTTLNTTCTGNQGQYRDAFNLQFQGGTEAGGGRCGQYAYIGEDVTIRSDGSFEWEFSNAFVDIDISGQFSGNRVSGKTRVINDNVDCSIGWTASQAGGGGSFPPPLAAGLHHPLETGPHPLAVAQRAVPLKVETLRQRTPISSA